MGYARKHLQKEFPDNISYSRIVELKRESFMRMFIYLKTSGLANCTGISFIDSTPLPVFNKISINQHRSFKGLAQRGQCSLGWFYGFKLHIITKDQGVIIDFMITKGNVDGRRILRFKDFVKKYFGKLFGDKGDLSKELFTELFSSSVRPVTKLRKNMKTKLLTPMAEAYHLRKRAIMEAIFDKLKSISQVGPSRSDARQIISTMYSRHLLPIASRKKAFLEKEFSRCQSTISSHIAISNSHYFIKA